MVGRQSRVAGAEPPSGGNGQEQGRREERLLLQTGWGKEAQGRERRAAGGLSWSAGITQGPLMEAELLSLGL